MRAVVSRLSRCTAVRQRLPATLSRRTFYTVKSELPPIVSCEWLSGQLERENVKVVDASWYLPSANRSGAAEFSTMRIPGATFFDLDEIRDTSAEYPRMMPSAEQFEVHMSQLGLTHKDIIVVYDGAGIFSAPRAWFMLKAMGAKHVAILDGGFPLWRKQKKEIETGPMTGAFQTETDAFHAKFSKISVADTNRVKKVVSGIEDAVVLDARSRARFFAEVKETKPGLRSGHIPGSISMHYKQLLCDDGLTMRPLRELETLFAEFGIDVLKRPVVASCGSGVTACVVAYGVHLLQWAHYIDDLDLFPPICVYDGSWAEWGSRADTPVESKAPDAEQD